MKCNLLLTYLFFICVTKLSLSHSHESNTEENEPLSSSDDGSEKVNYNGFDEHYLDIRNFSSNPTKENNETTLNKTSNISNISEERSPPNVKFLVQIHQDDRLTNTHNNFNIETTIYSVADEMPKHNHNNSVEIITLMPKITSNAKRVISFNKEQTINDKDNISKIEEIPFKSFNNVSNEHENNFTHDTTINKISVSTIQPLTNESTPISVRKCCGTSHFFSLVTSSCEPTASDEHFQSSIINLLGTLEKENVFYNTGTLKSCPATNEPPSIVSDITNSTHIILDSGNIMDKSSHHVFSQDEYCLELVGAQIEEAALTLAYCNSFETPEFYDYHSELETEEPLLTEDSYEHIVRKCCGKHEYYSTDLHKCTVTEDSKLFPFEVQKLSFEAAEIDLKIISSRIQECPDKSIQPKIIPVDSNAYRLLHTGDIIDVKTGLHHNYSYYCLEMVGPNTQELSFTLALCSKSFELPKCCSTGKYFDEIQLDCLPLPFDNNFTDIKQNYNLDSETYSVVPVGHFLRCQNTFPVQETAENLFISEGKLCNNIACFEKEEFCIDYIGRDTTKSLKASAFYCQKEYFIKCCKEGHILSEKGCIPHNKGKSVLLEHLTNTRNFVNSFDTKVCRKNKGVLLDQSLASYVIWWVSNDGSYITISAEPNKKNVHNYCVDDFIDKDGKIGPGAYVCDSDVNHLLPNEHHFLRYSDRGSLGKCCPENLKPGYVFHFSSLTGNCELISYNNSLKENTYLKEGSFVKEHFHDFPECPTHITGYHSFPFEPGTYDNAEISSKGILKIISKDGKCVTREDIVDDRDYCIEYVLTSDGQLKPSAFLCAYAPVARVYEEKFTLITTLLGISCLFLFFTLIFLCTVRVRRGFVTVRKVNTLAGRILVSFIASHLIGFAAFSMTQHENSLNKEDTLGCAVLAGFVQFFNLATFCWNTSICLESLLLTIDISISKCVRYLLHSLWAWGFPCVMTIIMFLMDYFREDLPCGFITPKIGVSYCFHSDNDSKLVYFYVPILLTLIANVAFIFGAKSMRKSRLRRLEKGTVKGGGASSRTESGTEGINQQTNSGMRTHQNQNTKAESLRIVLWTGGTWFSELAGFILTRYIIKHTTEEWYEYLWYIPTSINALRGVGIFAIIVLTPEKRKEFKLYLKRTKIRLRKLYKAFKDSKESTRSRRSTQKSSFGDDRKRNMSVTTMISTLSFSFYNNSSSFKKRADASSMRKMSIGSYISSKFESLRKTYSNNNNNNNNEAIGRKSSNNNAQNRDNKPMRKFGMIRSVSQIDRRASNSSGNSFIEELEMEENHCRRKCSIPLPKLQEEESCLERGECTEINMESLKENDKIEDVDKELSDDTAIVHNSADSEETATLNSDTESIDKSAEKTFVSRIEINFEKSNEKDNKREEEKPSEINEGKTIISSAKKDRSYSDSSSTSSSSSSGRNSGIISSRNSSSSSSSRSSEIYSNIKRKRIKKKSIRNSSTITTAADNAATTTTITTTNNNNNNNNNKSNDGTDENNYIDCNSSNINNESNCNSRVNKSSIGSSSSSSSSFNISLSNGNNITSISKSKNSNSGSRRSSNSSKRSSYKISIEVEGHSNENPKDEVAQNVNTESSA